MAGKSLLPALQGNRRDGHPILFNEHEGGRYVRTSEWKLVTLDAKQPWELYKISEDRTETINVAEENPEVVKELEGKWYEWAEANQVLPKP